MSEVSGTADRNGAHRLWLAAAVAAALAVAGAVGVLYAKRRNTIELPEPAAAQIVHKGQFARYAVGSFAKLQTWPAPRTPPQIRFKDLQGKAMRLADYRGKVVVMNIWARWCQPCRVEMPTLVDLQRRYEGKDLVVVPVSIDEQKDYQNDKNFMDVHNPLPLLFDAGDIPSTLKLRGFPSTMIYDRDGREIARLEGEATWNTPEAYAFFDALLKQK
jgi:thiol-disulfide isomerase/thioredoxin